MKLDSWTLLVHKDGNVHAHFGYLLEAILLSRQGRHNWSWFSADSYKKS